MYLLRRIYVLLLIFIASCKPAQNHSTQPLPEWMKGKFADDYGVRYTVNDSLFIMENSAKYHILQWNEREQYLLTRNDTPNKSEKGLYTRIDYMRFTGMEPFEWGYCFTIYDPASRKAALEKASADRSNPKKGCNGYPFSRMKRRE